MRLLLRSSLLVFIALAVVLHLPALDATPVNTTFAQGAFIPLMKAERDLKQGNSTNAMGAFQLAAMRAHRAGDKAAFQRIRWRMGAAGKTTSAKDFEKGWPFLARYALWSGDFDRDARRVESWTLSRFHKPTVFDYPVILNSHRTIWNDGPKHIALWIPRRLLPKNWRDMFKSLAPDELRALPHGLTSRLYAYPLGWRRAYQGSDTSLELGRQAYTDYTWYLKPQGREAWQELPIPGAPPFAHTMWHTKNWSGAQIVAIGTGPVPPFQVGLIHTYQALQ